jgi:hypothetical protein
LELIPVIAGSLPRLSVQSLTTGDSRDAIDESVDLLLTDDPAAVRYASARSDIAVVPLSWTRTYVLLSSRVGGAGRDSADDRRRRPLRQQLATDVVRAESRPAELPYWWTHLDGCATNPTGDSPDITALPGTRVVYRREDPVARALAERLVALAAIGEEYKGVAALPPPLLAEGGGTTAVGLSPEDFEASLRIGSELAFVLDLPSRSLSPCRDLAKLAAVAPWLVLDPADSALSLVPLVETRNRAIVRKDRLSLAIDWDGSLRIGMLETPR